MHLDPSIQKAIAAGTAHTLADSTRLDSYDTPVAGDDLKEHCSSAQGYLPDANSLVTAGLKVPRCWFCHHCHGRFAINDETNRRFLSLIDYYHKNYQTKDKPLRLMQFVHRSSNIIGYILIIASGILFYSLDSSLETYMTSIIFGKWASEAAR